MLNGRQHHGFFCQGSTCGEEGWQGRTLICVHKLTLEDLDYDQCPRPIPQTVQSCTVTVCNQDELTSNYSRHQEDDEIHEEEIKLEYSPHIIMINDDKVLYSNERGLTKTTWNHYKIGYKQWDFYHPDWSLKQQQRMLFACFFRDQDAGCKDYLKQLKQKKSDFKKVFDLLPEIEQDRILNIDRKEKLLIKKESKPRWAGTGWRKCSGKCKDDKVIGKQHRLITCRIVPFASLSPIECEAFPACSRLGKTL